MHPIKHIATSFIILAAVVVLVDVAVAQPPRFPLALEPEGAIGEAVFPAYEGWARNEDGSMTLIVGYFNRNEFPIDVPIGEDNRIEPGGPEANPDSNVWVGFGDRTVDEMAHAWVNVTYFDDETFEQEVAKREAANTEEGGGQ